MAIGDPGQGEFRDCPLEHRNLHIAAGLAPLMTLREELTTNDDLQDRGGTDDKTRDHFLLALGKCDDIRRSVTYNPDDLPLGAQIALAIDPHRRIEQAQKPAGGDNIQMGSGGLYHLPWDLSGGDPNVPLMDTLRMSNHGMILLGAVNRAIVGWCRLNSRHRTRYITQRDSMRIYGHYQEILDVLVRFGGDENRMDVAQLRATEEPRGAEHAPNRKTETPGSAE